MKSLVSNSPAAMMVVAADAAIVCVSDALVHLSGFEHSECEGKPFWEFLHADERGDARALWGRLSRLVAGKSPQGFNCRRADGTPMRIEASASAAGQGDGRVYLVHIRPAQARAAPPSPADSEAVRGKIALESAQQGVWDRNLITGADYFSPTWRTMRGLAADFDVSKLNVGWIDRIHPDDRERVAAYVQRQDSGELTEIAYDYRERHADGHWVWILARGRWIEWTEDGRPARIVGTDTDITEVKRAEAELRAMADHEMRWKIAVESGEQGLWDHDHVTNAKYYSPSWYKMRGLPPNSPAPSREEWLTSIHPEDRDDVIAYTSRQDLGELATVSHEYRQRHADGHWVWILSRGKAVSRDANGAPTRLIGTDTDITHLKTSEEELRRLSRRLELALSTSRVGVWEYNIGTRTAQWDKRMYEMFGLTAGPGTLPVGTWERALHPEDYDRAARVAYEAIEQGTDYSIDYRIIRGDGEVRHIRCRAGHSNGRSQGSRLIGVNWDVTDDYRRAEELEAANRRAEQQNAALEAARAGMEFISMHDSLTGLPNRRQLDVRLNAAETTNSAASRRVALLHVDLDRFKQINDTLGHAAGDAVLMNAASVLTEAVGETGLVARVGGDEFVVLIEGAPSEEALSSLATGIIERMAVPVTYRSHACRCGVSIGVAVAEGARIDARKLLIDADIALYRAKNEGRNRCCFFDAQMQVEVVANKRCADEILTGLERGEFFPVYQLQFDAWTHAIAGVEALARWRHPTRGVLAPDAFLRVAEDLNAVVEIDRLVLQQALADFASWQQQGLGIPCVSVNVSSRRLRDEELLASLRALEFAPGTLSFELLESIFLDDSDDVVTWNIDQIRELGIGIDIDDFGTGHASIVGLLNLRPNRLKIDRQLVAPIVASPQQRRLVASIVEIGKSQGIEVVAEGVETAEHAEILEALGCDVLQGYYFARPMPAADLATFLARRRSA